MLTKAAQVQLTTCYAPFNFNTHEKDNDLF